MDYRLLTRAQTLKETHTDQKDTQKDTQKDSETENIQRNQSNYKLCETAAHITTTKWQRSYYRDSNSQTVYNETPKTRKGVNDHKENK